MHAPSERHAHRQQGIRRNRHGFSLYRLPKRLAVCKIATRRLCQCIALEECTLPQVKFFVLYILNDADKIVHLKAMTWPPGVGISKYPRLGGSNNQRAAFRAYTSAFSAAEFETFPTFYTDNVTLKLPNHGTLDGREEIVGFYKKMFPKIRESLEIEHLIADDNGICAKITSTFTAVEDTTEYFGDFRKGAKLSIEVFVVYGLRGGLISSIDVGRRQ